MKFTTGTRFYVSRIACLCLAAILVACVPQAHRMPAKAPTAADKTFETLSRRYFDEIISLTPVTATSLGDHRFDNKLDDVGEDGRAKRLALESQLLGALHALDSAQLSRAYQV